MIYKITVCMNKMKSEYIKRIQDLSFTFAKWHYDQYLKEKAITSIRKNDIKKVVDDIYTTDKKNDLARFIRTNLKQSYGPAYNSFLTENIMNNIFEDDAYTKQRICTEIEYFQEA